MGCCLSSSSKKHPKHQHFQEPHKTHNNNSSRAPPPTVEEETVKEVLSETPISKGNHTHDHNQKQKTHNAPQIPLQQEQKQASKPQMPTTLEELQEEQKEPSTLTSSTKHEEQETSEVSQVSEMYSASVSVSESFSVSTQTTVPDKHKGEDDEAISSNANNTQKGVKRANRSPAMAHRKRPYSGELVSGRERLAKSPARTAEPSPEKRRAQVRSRSTGQPRSGAGQRNVGTSRGVRRDVGEVSGRRSRSPATRAPVGERRVGGNGLNKGPTKVSATRPGNVESSEKKEDVKSDDVQKQQQQGNESIENPHVALECFIFL